MIRTSPKCCKGSACIFGHCTVNATTETFVCGHWDDQIVLYLHSCMAEQITSGTQHAAARWSPERQSQGISWMPISASLLLGDIPGRSPSMVRKGVNMPLDFSVRVCATLILEAATIFMALVIFAIFWTERILCLTAGSIPQVKEDQPMPEQAMSEYKSQPTKWKAS